MEERRKTLVDEMTTVDVSPKVLRALNELTYTASETGLLPFAFHDDEDLIIMIKLVHLAERYQENVPNSLRM
jgi:hypothetical protein